MAEVDRLRDVVERALLQQRAGATLVAVAADDDDGDARVDLAELGEDADTALSRHPQIEEHGVGPVRGELGDRLVAVHGRPHGIAGRLERLAEHGKDSGVVVDDEDVTAHGARRARHTAFYLYTCVALSQTKD